MIANLPSETKSVAIRVFGNPFKPAPMSHATATADLPEFGVHAGDVLVLLKLGTIDCDCIFMLADYRLVRVQHWGRGQARVTDQNGAVEFLSVSQLRPIARLTQIEKEQTK